MKENLEDKPSREAKHVTINHAIDRLLRVAINLEDLSDEIAGTDKPEVTKEGVDKSAPPSLEATLDNSGGRIIDLAERIYETKNKIRGQIF